MGFWKQLFGRGKISNPQNQIQAHRETTADEKDQNLLRWKQTGYPQKWVNEHLGQWNDADWLELLEKLRRTNFWPMEPDAIGTALEKEKEDAMVSVSLSQRIKSLLTIRSWRRLGRSFRFLNNKLWQWLRRVSDVLLNEPSWRKLMQRLLLVACVLLLTAPFLLFLRHFNFLPNSGGSIKVSAIGGTGIEINYPTGDGKSESVAVISVPAYRMATASGIVINSGDSIEIAASGTIATDSAFNDWLPHETQKPPASPEDIMQDAINRFTFNHNANPSWRDADGSRISGLGDELITNKLLHIAHEKYKLLPDTPMPDGNSKINDYGLLIGCVLPPEMTDASNLNVIAAVTKMRKESKLFRIGKKVTFKCSKVEGKEQMKLCFTDNSNRDVVLNGTKGTLFLLINDIVVDKKMLRELIKFVDGSQATDEEKKRDKQAFETALRIYDPEAPLNKNVKNSKKFNLLTQELWYWDNIGSFTVVVSTKASH